MRSNYTRGERRLRRERVSLILAVVLVAVILAVLIGPLRVGSEPVPGEEVHIYRAIHVARDECRRVVAETGNVELAEAIGKAKYEEALAWEP